MLDKINRGETMMLVGTIKHISLVFISVISLLPARLGTSFSLCRDSQVAGTGRRQRSGLVGVRGEADSLSVTLPLSVCINYTSRVCTGSVLACGGAQRSGAP